MPVDNRIQEAFDRAKGDFQKELNRLDLLDEIKKTTSIEEVYEATKKLQETQSKRGGLRHLRKIEPYLERLRQYADVINTFVQAKADVLALIWGPVRLLLQLASNLSASFDAIVNALANIGNKLPIFKEYTQLFGSNDRIKDVLCLFFKDILDLYLAALEFFSAKHWKLIFESVWPRHKPKLDLVAHNIERHSILMKDEVNLDHIREAHDARLEALKHYELEREFRERQEFDAVETYISPRFYDRELNELLRRNIAGSGKWLEKEKVFTQWLDHADGSVKVLWLQGIPGAGKTHLSSNIVNQARQSSCTLFAFLSYKQSGDLSTISILHSLIFQLVTKDKSLRVMLCARFQSNRRELKSSTKFAAEMLTTLLKCAGPTYVVIDGLDENDAGERRITLCELLNILKDSDETKLLISSRQEDDIAKSLKDSAQTIRVDYKNAGCIQTYITGRIQQWFDDSDFEEEARSEIKGLLAPLAAKAKGMFLYARIVMDSITQMYSNLDLIRREIRILPESLDEVYNRNRQRLNDQPSPLRERAIRLLGWIGCSPVPLTRLEVEQALCIRPGEIDKLPNVWTRLNVVELCGPIIEIFDDRLYFVHFTVKEYLFDRQKPDRFIDLMQANLDLAMTCITYLCVDLFDPDVENEDVVENIISGGYRLFHFAAFQWIGIVRRCSGALGYQNPPDGLVELLEIFVDKRENPGYEPQTKDTPEFSELKIFKTKWPKLYEILCRALQFSQLDLGSWRVDENCSWANHDPFTISYSSLDIYKQFEACLCPGPEHRTNCKCQKLQRNYGTRLFRCKYMVCHSRRIAFETRSSRDKHAKRHGRPFKCTIPTCDFAELGFQSHNQFQKHWLQCHQDTAPKPNRSDHEVEDNEIQPLLYDLVAMGKVDEVKQLLPRFQKLPSYVQGQLRRFTAGTGPVAILEFLMKGVPTDDDDWVDVLTESTKEENVEVLMWAGSKVEWEHLNRHTLGKFYCAAVSSNRAEAFEFFSESLSDKLLWNDPVILLPQVVRAANSPASQVRLAALWKKRALIKKFDKRYLNRALGEVASSHCSAVLARILVELGADVNYRDRGRRAKAPIHKAATRDSAAAAELIKFLLLCGADPDVRSEQRRACEEKGARNISKWLGMTWDQLVNHALQESQKQLHAPQVSKVQSHALQDTQMQLMLLEQQNKRRFIMAHQDLDTMARADGQPNIPGQPGLSPRTSPQDSRSGASPNAGEQMKRGTPKMPQAGLPGSGSSGVKED